MANYIALGSELARNEGRLKLGPLDSGEPVGYWAFIEDPDGHNLEISYGQEVGFTVSGGSGSMASSRSDL